MDYGTSFSSHIVADVSTLIIGEYRNKIFYRMFLRTTPKN